MILYPPAPADIRIRIYATIIRFTTAGPAIRCIIPIPARVQPTLNDLPACVTFTVLQFPAPPAPAEIRMRINATSIRFTTAGPAIRRSIPTPARVQLNFIGIDGSVK